MSIMLDGKMNKKLTEMPEGQSEEFQRDNRIGRTNVFNTRKTGVQAGGTSMLKGSMGGKPEGASKIKN